ncbi:hypothetical protein QYM36_003103 [Artemia franciscana]|uniref:Ig-like domain-containing protein n=1 Tax=Artemia franciscana TaxID=6661 RepID=A0AA88I7G5_ARTSF|nr:hypothetical protein QYM36_003103 [Artemia franciscana]
MKIVPTRILASVGIVALFVGQALCSTQSPPLMVKQPPTDELLFQVATRIDENDKPFIIECEAEGEPAPKYRWEKNGHEFLYQTEDYRISQQPGRGTLVITQPKDVDIGQYQCFATNEFGTAASNSVFVRKSELSNFKEEPPKSISEQEGKPFSLRCQPPDGWPKPSVYWMIQSTNGALRSVNSSRMTVDPEGTLWFSNITREDSSEDFLYACSATSKFRNEYKLGNRVYLEAIPSGNSAVQNRHEPVQQYVSRKNMVGYRGERVELWCVFGGTPLPQIKWNKRGGALTSSRVDYTNYGKTLVIKSVDFEDEGSYECGASNGVGSPKSYSITLEVQAKPYFTVEPEVVRAAEDDTAVFRCEASGKPAPEIQWIHNGKPIESFPSNPRRKVRPNEIVIEKLTKQDTGNYGCNATNSLGYAYKDVYLNVLGAAEAVAMGAEYFFLITDEGEGYLLDTTDCPAMQLVQRPESLSGILQEVCLSIGLEQKSTALPPEIVEPPEDIATVDGSSVNMTCKVTGAPKPEVKWVRDGLELTGGRYKVMEDGNLEIRANSFKVFLADLKRTFLPTSTWDVTFSDAGAYSCFALNKFGSIDATGNLVVKERTRIVDEPEDYEVAAGSTATFRCTAISDSSLTLRIDWMNENETIDFEQEPRFVQSQDFSLTITKTTELDTGEYTCVARTELDSATAKASLIVEDVPNAPKLVGVRCNPRDAVLEWIPQGDNRSPIIMYTVQHNTSFTPDSWEVSFESVPATDRIFTSMVQREVMIYISLLLFCPAFDSVLHTHFNPANTAVKVSLAARLALRVCYFEE